MGRITARTPARRLTLGPQGVLVDGGADTLAVEEPLEIRVDGVALSMTMRTPGDDFDLALGWLSAEGAIAGASDVRALRHCVNADTAGRRTYNVVEVTPAPGVRIDLPARATTTTSACGICGSDSIDVVHRRSRYEVARDSVRLDPGLLAELPGRMRHHQPGFARTGGTHAAGIFDADGELLCLREDVGRHNAVDKVVGWALREDRLPLTGCVLVVSGRAGFELAHKAVLAGIPAMISVSAATSLSVDLARRSGLTLAAFVRPPHLTVYSDPGRIVGLDDPPAAIEASSDPGREASGT